MRAASSACGYKLANNRYPIAAGVPRSQQNPEYGSLHGVSVDGFWIDRTPETAAVPGWYRSLRTFRFPGEGDVDRLSLLANRDANETHKRHQTRETSGKAGGFGGFIHSLIELMVRGTSRQLVEFETSIRPKRDDVLWQ